MQYLNIVLKNQIRYSKEYLFYILCYNLLGDIMCKDKNAIGIFDSGIGGLTVLNELIKILPNEKYIYIGDNKNCPYGDKTIDELHCYSKRIIKYFESRKVKLIVIACNTISSNVIDILKKETTIPLIGVIDSTVDNFIAKKIDNTLIIATNKTIESNAYEKKIKKINETIEVNNLRTPLLVPSIENNCKDVDIILNDYLKPYIGKVKSIILGCTHYPLIINNIKKILNVEIISSSNCVSKSVYEFLNNNNLFGTEFGIEIYTTGDEKSFNERSINIIKYKANNIDLDY